MRNDLTDITLVIDRSGSMSSCRDEAQKGINEFIKKQKEVEGEVLFSLLQFDTEHEYVFNAVPISNVGKYKLIPRGMTALLDAVGKAVTETGIRLEKVPESERPGLVIIAIITDGYENASSEFKRDRIKEMIEHQQGKYSWQFTFLGANQNAFLEAGSIGINMNVAANYNTSKSDAVYNNLSNHVSRMRNMSYNGEVVSSSYTEEERESME